MQYESNPANGFRDIVWKRNTDPQMHRRTDVRPDMVMTIPSLILGRVIITPPLLLRGLGMEKELWAAPVTLTHKKDGSYLDLLHLLL